MLSVHLRAVGCGPTLCAKVPFVHLHQSHFLLLPPDDGHGEQQAATVRHLVLHRLENRGVRFLRLLCPVRRHQPAAHPGHHHAERVGVRNADDDAPEDREAAQHQRQRPG